MPLDTGAARPAETIGRGAIARVAFVLIESVVAVAGLIGAGHLITGTATPPVSVLEPMGLSSWALPGLWLSGTVVVPSGTAAFLAWRRSSLAPLAVLLANATLAIELLVQTPLLGPSTLQAIFGAIAIAMATLAIRARSAGWWLRITRRPGTGPLWTIPR